MEEIGAMTQQRRQFSRRLTRFAAGVMLVCGVSGCATTGGNPQDPLESINRATFRFNETADRYVVRPTAQVYDTVMPLPVKVWVGNFFSNVGDIWIGVNNLLQGKVAEGLSDGGRVLINSTVGILGLFDVASELGLEKHDEDLGQTLARWGVGDGPYVVLPIFGPSNVRDTFGLVGDWSVDPVTNIDSVSDRYTAVGLRFVNRRAQLLGADTAAEEAALDKYSYMRSFYMQYRRNQIYDGRPPREKDPDDGE